MAEMLVNGAPMVIDQGVRDVSTKKVPREAEALPQHLPKFWTYAETGQLGDQLVSGNEAVALYGAKTFDPTSKYATSATPYIQGCFESGNQIMLERLVPADAPPPSSIIVWLDVLPCTVDLYSRGPDGAIITDSKGDPIVVGTAAGHKVKWVVTNDTDEESAADFGRRTTHRGDQVDHATSTQSTRYPWMELACSAQGSSGDGNGIRLWAPVTGSSSMPTKMMNKHAAYPYFIQVVRKDTDTGVVSVVSTEAGDQKLMFTFKPKSFDPISGLALYAGDTVIDAWQNITDPKYPKKYGAFGKMHVYQDNIDTLSKMFLQAEAPYIDEFSDFTSDESQALLFNAVGGVSSQNVPYHTYVFADTSNSVRWSEYSNVYAAGGGDGTMSVDDFNNQIRAKMAKYTDLNDPVQDRAVNVISHIYDASYQMETKRALLHALAVRRDIRVTLGTHIHGEEALSEAQEQSLASALLAAARTYSWSETFGTSEGRVTIMARSYRIRNSAWKDRVSLTYEVMRKRATYMGSGDGKWRNGKNYDGSPGSIIDNGYDLSGGWVGTTTRNRYWDLCLNYPLPFDRSSYYFPAIRSVYEDETSVLISDITCEGVCYLNKMAHRLHREFSGVSGLSDALLCKKVNDRAAALVKSSTFDGRLVVIPDAKITDMDALRGSVWTMCWKVGAPGMKTVQNVYTEVYRLADLTK